MSWPIWWADPWPGDVQQVLDPSRWSLKHSRWEHSKLQEVEKALVNLFIYGVVPEWWPPQLGGHQPSPGMDTKAHYSQMWAGRASPKKNQDKEGEAGNWPVNWLDLPRILSTPFPWEGVGGQLTSLQSPGMETPPQQQPSHLDAGKLENKWSPCQP